MATILTENEKENVSDHDVQPQLVQGSKGADDQEAPLKAAQVQHDLDPQQKQAGEYADNAKNDLELSSACDSMTESAASAVDRESTTVIDLQV